MYIMALMEAFTSGGAMGREKWSWCCCFLVLFLSLLQMEQVRSSQPPNNKTCHSSCGMIRNISYPFRLKDDPPHCGQPEYELACENNITILHLLDYYDTYYYYYLGNSTLRSVGRYRVLGIDYNNYKIRLVDEGIEEKNCSSLPLSSLSLSNIEYEQESGYVSSSAPYSAGPPNRDMPRIVKQVGYLECRDPVREDAAYVDTSPCVNWKGGGHVYAVAGDLTVDQFQPQCIVRLVTLIASDWESLILSLEPNNNGGRIKSYYDIHRLISYGFELSWSNRVCADTNCPDGTNCVLVPEAQGPQCRRQYRDCATPLGIPNNRCRRLPRVRIFAEDFVHGIWRGLTRIANWQIDEHTDNDSGPSKLLIKLGAFTGRFVVPFITVRFGFGVVLLSTVLIYTWRRRHLSLYEDIEDFIRLHDLIPIRYSYKDLKTMTEGFKNKLGEGGFGTVYKGKLRSGPDVAIKMLGKSKANGHEFISEVATIGRIHHFNVVHLVGFCVEGAKRALVYEFMPNGSLDKHIFSHEQSISLSYHKVYEICLGIAHGIAYLHHGCDMQILHFDIKPHNILLDDSFIPKISDFGLARLYPVDDSIVTLTEARGTLGYIAPELFFKNVGGVSYKADVYSFGMLLMEMANRKRNSIVHGERSSEQYFPLWIYDQFDEEKNIQMEDLTDEEKNVVKKMFIVALWCIQLKPTDRPSMIKVIEMLEADDAESLEMPPKPSLFPIEELPMEDGSYSSDATFTISIHSQSGQGKGASDGK